MKVRGDEEGTRNRKKKSRKEKGVYTTERWVDIGRVCKHIRKYRKRRKRRSITDTHNTAEDERSGKREAGRRGRWIRKRDDDSWLYGARRACVNGDRRKQRVRVGEVGRKADSTKTTKRASDERQRVLRHRVRLHKRGKA